MVAAKILATSEISTFLVFKQGAFYHSNGYSCTLFNTGTQKSVVDAWGPLLDHIFFLFPPPPTHTHIVFSSLICSNGYDSPLPFAKTLNFSFKYICSFFPPPISVSLLFLLICKIGKKQYNVQKINRFDWEN